MARAEIIPEDQISRLNKLSTSAENIKNLELDVLKKRPSEKSWCAIEVIEHMVLGHKDYIEKLDHSLSVIKDKNEPIDKIKARSTPSFLIKRFPPKKGKIRFKMKTMKRFYPVFDLDEIDHIKADVIFKQFFSSIDHLTKTIEAYRTKEAESHIFPSAVGAWVKFNVAEAVEFIICHNERHMQQIQNVLKQVSPEYSKVREVQN